MRQALVPVVVMLALAGCIQNMADLKERLGAAEEPVEPAALVEPTPAPPATNSTTILKPPVARIAVFGPNGALVYKSTFKADDPSEVVLVPEKSKINLIASDSEPLEPGATLTSFTWTLNGKALEAGRNTSAEVGEAGLYVVSLVVTDSNGKSDDHTVKLGVAPTPYDVTIELTTGPIVGANEEGLAEMLPFTLGADESKGPSAIQKIIITARPDLGLDAILDVLDAEGTIVGQSDNAGHDSLDQTETVELGAIALGDYAVTIRPAAGADPDGVPITIVVTYMPIIEGLGGDGHAHAH